ncbi:helix-turn-helix transcriptional regulator [Deinococcus altitudinis]|uniref:helix-turn-helix transcriptional regulator n=1 Tax=Deinococcus altitudinis TaxID=468914 RepID=UPI00389135D9
MTYDPSMRVLTVLELLQSRERLSGGELCRRLEVSPRTVQRYVARLQDLGIPVESTRGVGGSYRLKPGFRLPPLMFTADEALSIALGLRALRLLGLQALTPAATAATAKLARTLPHALSERVQALQDAVQLDVSPWVLAADNVLLTGLLAAMEAGQPVTFRYTSRGAAASVREVEVYGTVHVFGRWYAVGHCRTRRAIRSFRLDRIEALGLLEGHYTRPPDFDALAHLRASLPKETSEHKVEVYLDAPLAALQPQLTSWGVTLSGLPGDRTRLVARRNRLEPLAAGLLGLGCAMTVLEPPELRAVFARMADHSARASLPPGPADMMNAR